MIKIGEKAPGFSLYDTERNAVSLEDFKGKNVLLVFFPLAFTSTCTAELCSIRDGIAVFNEANAVVLGISVDSIFVLKKFKEEQHLNFTLISDFNREVSTTYDAVYEEFTMGMKGVSKRAVFVIDKEGNLKYQEILENAKDLPDFELVKKELANIA